MSARVCQGDDAAFDGRVRAGGTVVPLDRLVPLDRHFVKSFSRLGRFQWVLSFKSTDPDELEPDPDPALTPEQDRLRAEFEDEMFALLSTPLPSDPESVIEREEKRQTRELRRKCDQLMLEAALGFDQELIERFVA
jgi:hypothetical protein